MINQEATYREKSRIKTILTSGLVCFCLLSLVLSCAEEEKYKRSDENNFHLINIRVDSDTHLTGKNEKETRGANPSNSKVSIEDIVLFTVEKKSRLILNAVEMEKRTNNAYGCQIPGDIDLPAAEFYAVANVKANFGEFTQLQNKPFDDFLDRSVQSTHEDNNIAAPSSSTLHYPLMNREAATYNSATRSISNITLFHLPARIYLDCERLGYPVKKFVFNNISRHTSLRTVIEKKGNERKEDLFNWTDTLPGIAGDGTDYYYLVYPSDQKASIVVTSSNNIPVPADLGYLKPGYSYTVRLNYPVGISFDDIAVDGKITLSKGQTSGFEFKVDNTAIARKVELESSDESVFKVTGGIEADWNKFTLEGISAGEATLTAKCMGSTIRCSVVVSDNIHSVTVNGEITGSYTTGEEVTIQAPFKERNKFTHWTTDLETTANAWDLNSPTLTFTMPASAVSFTAEYAEAPQKVTVNKPGKIVNSRDGHFEPALVQETATSYIRYYATNDEVRIQAPEQSPDSGTQFKLWTVSDDTDTNIYYYLNNTSAGGGGQHPTTWFRMNLSSDAEFTPTYPNAPYWSTRSTAKGYIIANFIERENPVPGMVTIPGGATLYRAFDSQEKECIMRALNTVENTFANAPRRTIRITFAVNNIPGALVGGGTEPVAAHYVPPYDRPKPKWLASDFGGRATGIIAASSKFEAVWRDQLNMVPDDADEDNHFVGYCDGYTVLSHSYIQDLYKGEDENGISPGQIDFETLILHELAHIICYHSFNTPAPLPAEGLMALDVFVATASDPVNKNVVNGTFEDDGDYPIIYNELVKSYCGRYPRLRSNDFGHLIEVGAIGSFSLGSSRRKFADFELALLSEMGWKINPDAWDNPPAQTKHR